MFMKFNYKPDKNNMYDISIASTGKTWNDYIEIYDYNTDSSKKIQVRHKNGISWQLNKNSLSCDGGAISLYCFFADSVKNDFMTAYLHKTITHFFGSQAEH